MMDAKCRKCRREGKKLFLKGDRCKSAKCALVKRAYAPGPHGQKRAKKISEYGKQLREKQKAKRMYGLRERQFSNYFKKASKNKAATGEILLQFLERRLDNVVFKVGFAPSRKAARQFVLHGHILVNGKKVNIPSYIVDEKEKIEPKSKEGFKLIKSEIPSWIDFKQKDLVAQIAKMPTREELPQEINESLIVEFYSR